MEKFSVVIQAGGDSTRMGRDKGLLEFQGVTLIEYILTQVEGCGDETLIISNWPQEYERFGIQVHTDVMPGLGALGGIYSALYYAKHELCMILACDMPFVNVPLMNHLLSLAGGYDAVMPRLDPQEYAEPFRAVYRKTCLNAIKHRLAANQLQVSVFFEDVNLRFVELAEIVKFDAELDSFFNVNVPGDLVRAVKIAEGRE